MGWDWRWWLDEVTWGRSRPAREFLHRAGSPPRRTFRGRSSKAAFPGLPAALRDATIGGMLQPEMPALRAGDAFAWELAFHGLWPLAWSAARRRLPRSSPQEVEDIAISAIEQAARAVIAGQVADLRKLRALVVVIARRRAIDHLRRQASAGRIDPDTDPDAQPDPGRGPLDRLSDLELAEILDLLSHVLRGPEREVLRDYYTGGLKLREIAEKHHLPLGTVGAMLHRALGKLRAELATQPRLLQELEELLR